MEDGAYVLMASEDADGVGLGEEHGGGEDERDGDDHFDEDGKR